MTDTTDPAQLGTDDAAVEAHNMAQAGKGFGPAEQRQLAEWAVADGTMTREEANAALQADGLDPLAAGPQHEPGSPAAEIDAAFPPAKPEEYNLPSLLKDPERDAYTPELQEFDQLRRNWLSSAGFPRGIGESVMRHAHDAMENFATLDDEAVELQKRVELERTREVLGENADEDLALAQKLVNEIEAKHPGLVGFLEVTGAGNNRFVITQFAHQARRLYDRQG